MFPSTEAKKAFNMGKRRYIKEDEIIFCFSIVEMLSWETTIKI